jgi:predicted glycosyltransferase
MMRPRVLFYVQHLLGIGHLVRGVRIARALARSGFAVDLVLGGMPVAGLDIGEARLVTLPPVRAGSGFSRLLDERGEAFGEAAQNDRRDRLLAHFEATSPHVVLIEAFPFGRRQMDFELLPLLDRIDRAAPRPLVAVSIRDILQRGRKPEREQQTVEILDRHVDLVLVHGDARLVRLAETFPLADRFADRTVYTGMVGPEPGDTFCRSEHDVIVSAGGGAVGAGLIAAALAARPRTSLRHARWLVVTGPNLARAEETAFLREAGAGVELVRFLADLPQRLHGATLSISQAGYNTVADLLAARCRSVLVPFAQGGETEQTDRARLLEARGAAVMIEEGGLDADALAAAIERALALPKAEADIDLDGAYATAAILAERLVARG